jgi:acetyl esterase
MPLHPDLEAFLELAAAGRSRPLRGLTPALARAEYDRASLEIDTPGETVGPVENLEIPCRDGHGMPARLYFPSAPETADGKPPALLYFHGGGYTVGGLDSHDSLCRALARRAPCAVLSAAYRLAPEHKFPTACHDAEDAYRWLLENGALRGIDAERLAVGGDSVGGTLAAGLALAARDGDFPAPAAQILLYPCTGADQDTGSHRRYASGYLLEAETLQWMFRNYLRGAADRKDRRFAPLEADDLGGLPPAFIALAEYDPLVDEGVAYAERLRAAGVATRLEIYAGMVHDFARLGNIVPEAADRVRSDIARALADAFSLRLNGGL